MIAGLEVSLSELDVHAVAKVFKAYLAEHEPLFLFENYEELVQCGALFMLGCSSSFVAHCGHLQTGTWAR